MQVFIDESIGGLSRCSPQGADGEGANYQSMSCLVFKWLFLLDMRRCSCYLEHRMLLSLFRRLLAVLLATCVLMGGAMHAEEEFYDDAPSAKKSKKKKKNKKKKKKSRKKRDKEEDYWSGTEWDTDDADSSDADDADDEDTVTKADVDAFFSGADDKPEPVVDKRPSRGSAGEAPAPRIVAEQAPAVKPVVQPGPVPPAPVVSPRDECVKKMLSRPGEVAHTDVEVQHQVWSGRLRINTEQKVLVRLNGRKDVATVLKFDDKELRVKWDLWSEEVYYRQSDGRYVQDAVIDKRVGDEMARRASRVGKRLRSRKAVNWEDYGWTGSLMDWVLGNKPPLTYKVLKLTNERGSFRVRFSEDEMVLAKMGEGNQSAVVLEYTGMKLHVRWENGSTASFKRQKDGSYRKIDDWALARRLREGDDVVREKSEDDWFTVWWRDVMDEEKPLSYKEIRMQIGGTECEPRLSMDNRLLVMIPPQNGWAKVVKINRFQLHIRWHDKQDEIFQRDEDKVYRRAR